jgi:hypothetical protein
MAPGRDVAFGAASCANRRMSLPQILYHGTSTKFLRRKLGEGLLPSHMTGAVLMTCLTDERESAEYHALCMAEFEAARPIVFAIPVERLDLSAFTLEDKFVELGPSAGRGLFAADLLGFSRWRHAPWTWRAMLSIAGAVGYTGTIAVTRKDILPVVGEIQ